MRLTGRINSKGDGCPSPFCIRFYAVRLAPIVVILATVIDVTTCGARARANYRTLLAANERPADCANRGADTDSLGRASIVAVAIIIIAVIIRPVIIISLIIAIIVRPFLIPLIVGPILLTLLG